MQLRRIIFVLISCICLSFSSFASDIESLLKEYDIADEAELEDALSTYDGVRSSIYGDDLYEALDLYGILKDYEITDTDELEDALYSYFYFNDAINDERLSDTQKEVLEEIESDNYYDGLYRGRMDVFTWIFFIAFILFIMHETGFLEYLTKL